METKKAVIYCRVSTKEQAEEGNSLVTQERICREYAQKYGYEIASVYIEHGESAKTADRTELKKLMSFCAVKKNGIKAVIAYKIDRISRNTDDYSQIRILLRRYGVEIKSTSEYFEDTPAGRFMENIIANVAQFDNDVRTERSVGGLRDAVREGRYVWMAPLGYSNTKVNGKSTIAPNDLAPLVRKIFETVALNIQPIEEVRKSLIPEGLVNANGKPISKSHFYRLIRHELYAGWINKFGERHKGAFEPLISEGLFQQVQYVLSKKSGQKNKYSIQHEDFPLRRFITHPSGQMLTGCWSKGRYKKYPYYLFHKQKINIRKELLECSFKHWLNQFRLDDRHFDKLLALVKKNLDGGVSDIQVKRESLSKKIIELKDKQALLVDKNIDGIISDSICRERIAAIDRELYQLQGAIDNLPESKVNYSALLKIIRGILLNPGDVWEKAGLSEKIKLQWFYFPHGIQFNGFESRTTKICKLFRLKEEILPLQSLNVHHPNHKSNTSNCLIPLSCNFYLDTKGSNMIFDELFWQEMGGEIAYLTNLIQLR